MPTEVSSVSAPTWYVIAGGIFVLMALAGSRIHQLPLSSAIIYLIVGLCLNQFNFLTISVLSSAPLIEVLSELVVIISLFSVGLKLRASWRDPKWLIPIRLATLSMVVTVTGLAVFGVVFLNLSLGAAVLLGGILSPTDPVLASDVQMSKPGERDELRFGLTGEGGFNDGTAFPFVMLGLGLLGLHELGEYGQWWLVNDLLWKGGGGLAVGLLSGWLVSKFCLYLRRHHKTAVGLDDFLSLGLIALSYGVAMLLDTYGFLAVFAAGSALRRIELDASDDKSPDSEVEEISLDDKESAVDPERAPAYMARAILSFNEQIERIGEVFIVVLFGAVLGEAEISWRALAVAATLFLVIRPVAIWVGLIGCPVSLVAKRYAAWFGVRGIGSIYYLCYAITHGLEPRLAQEIIGLTISVVALSIFVHGISVTPLMTAYQNKKTKGAFAS